MHIKRIKTREVVRGIKTLDRAANLSSKMKKTATGAKNKTEETQNTQYESPNEYAAEHLQRTAQNGVLDGAHHLKTAPKKAQKNIVRAKGHFQEVGRQMPQERQRAAAQAQNAAQTTRANADKLHKTAGQAEQKAQKTKSVVQDAKDTLRQVRRNGRQSVREAKRGVSTHTPTGQQTAHTPYNAASRPSYAKPPPRGTPPKAAQTAARSAKSAKKTVKQTAKGTVKTAKKTVKTAEQTARTTVKTAQQTARAAQQSAKAAAKAAKVAERTARAAAKAAVQTAKAAAKGVTAMVNATIAAVKGLVAAIAAGGWVAVFIILIVCLIGLLVASPFGIFFSSEPARDSIPLAAAVAHINTELNAEMEARQNERVYDDIIIHGGIADWVDVVAVYSCKTVGAGTDATDVVTFDADRIDKLMTVMRDMSGITYDVETIPHPEADTEYILNIRMNTLTADDAASRYGFTAQQREALAELLDHRAELTALIGDLTISNPAARETLVNLPPDLSPERRAAVNAALSLVGKVNYFWGGKSYAHGWDSAWGAMRRVTADGSSTTGTYRPFGLDCTGYLGWAFRNAGLTDSGTWHIGGNTVATTWANAQPGDIAFNADESHVGMVVGRDSSGDTLIAHCTYGANNVVITTAAEPGFVAVGVPPGFDAAAPP